MSEDAPPRLRVLMLVENNPYPQDLRVRNEATALQRAGHQVSVLAPRGAGQERVETVGGVRVHRYATAPAVRGAAGYLVEYGHAAIAMWVHSLVVFFREGFDVIHAHNPPDTLVLVAAFYRPLGKRFVFDLHDISPEMYHARFRTEDTGPLYRALQFFEWLSFRAAHHVIVTNESYARVALGRGGKRQDEVTVVRNGPDLDRVRSMDPDPELRRRSPFLIGYVGIMGQQDGVDYLLRALHHLRRDLGHEEFLCVLVGRGDAMPELRELVVHLDLQAHVEFSGYVPDDQLMRILSTVDVFVAPEPSNPFNDRSTMIKLTEYLVFGKPIVAFDLPEHRVTAGEAAHYARPNDELDFARGLARFIEDPEACRRAERVGRDRLESLTWAAQAHHLVDAYERISSAMPRRRGRVADGRPRSGESGSAADAHARAGSQASDTSETL